MALTQSHYRFGIDSGTEAAHGWHANENAVPVGLALDVVFLLRFNVQATASVAHANTVNQFQYSRNGGAFTNITTSSTVVRAVAAVALTNQGNCTKRLSGTGTFETTGAGQTETGASGGAANDLVANGCSETECGLVIRAVDVNDGDTLAFRLTCSPTAITTYAQTPTLTVVKTTAITGTLTRTLAPATASSTAISSLAGSLALTLAPASASSAGTLAVIGNLSRTLGAGSLVSTGTLALAGSMSRTLVGASAASTASVPAAGSLSRSLQAASLAAAGSLQLNGTLARTLAPAVVSASGSAEASAITGILVRTLAPAGVSASASISVAGHLATALQGAQAASAGSLGEATQAQETQQMTGRCNISSCIPTRSFSRKRR